MKVLLTWFVLTTATIFFLAGCAKSDEVSQSAEHAMVQIASAKELLATISSEESAKKNKDKFVAFGKEYSLAMEQISNIDPSDQDAAMALAPLMPRVATELQSLMLEVNALQSRSPEAAAILIPELKSFNR